MEKYHWSCNQKVNAFLLETAWKWTLSLRLFIIEVYSVESVVLNMHLCDNS